MRIKILNPSLVELGTIEDTNSAVEREGLNSFKELHFQTFLTPAVSALIADGNIAEVNSDYYDLAYFHKEQSESGDLNVSAEFEHVSYRLNDPEYDMEYFTSTGTPTAVLTAILEGTGFAVGTVEFTESVTYSIQEKSSRRKMLMDFVTLLGGEVDFEQFEISILNQRGSTTPKNITEGRNFTIIAVSFDTRKRDSGGNPLVAYSCKLINPMEINLGDVVTMQYGTLGIDTSLRVVSIAKNPYNSHDIEFEIGNFNPTLENDLYRIETSTVIKDKLYNGTRIGPEFGFEAVRNDKFARAYFNSDAFKMQSGDGSGSNWVDELYFDPVSKKYIFNGTLSATVIEAIKANIDIVVSNTIITQTLAAEKGNIAELTVDQLDTSDKVQNYLSENKADVNYIKAYDQHIEFITAVYATKQHWTTYPISPVSGYPYQSIIQAGANTRLIVSTAKWYYYFSGDTQLKSAATGKMYQLNAGVWEFVSDAANYSYTTILQANYDVYNDVSLATVLFAATHSDHVQLKNRFGNPIYWVDDTHTGTTLEVTAYPVFIYVYDEYIKMKQSFEEIDGAVIPIVTYGTGIGNVDHPERGRGFTFKDTNGMVMRYVTAAGVVQDIRNGENGIEFVGDTSNNYYSATNAAEVTVNTAETVVCTKDIAFSSRSKIIVNFSCTIQTSGGALSCKAKIYVNDVALPFQPEAYQASANKWVISFTDDKKGVASGTKTIAVKLVTDANSGTVAIGQSKMIVTVFVDPMPSLTNVSGFAATVISATQINLAWTNPT